ncbi:MAG: Fe-S-binding domain-containing protein, partial [Thermodesulfobacteriota bacterium]
MLVFFPRAWENSFKYFACVVSLADFLLSLIFYFRFDGSTANFQFVDKLPWIETFGISYFVGIDGISLFLILLTNLLSVLAIYSSFSAINRRVKEYYILMLFLQTGMLGVFMALDLFLFYVFWEAMLLP